MISKSDITKAVILYDKFDNTPHEVLDTCQLSRAFYVSVQDKNNRSIHGYFEYSLTDIRRFFKLKV